MDEGRATANQTKAADEALKRLYSDLYEQGERMDGAWWVGMAWVLCFYLIIYAVVMVTFY